MGGSFFLAFGIACLLVGMASVIIDDLHVVRVAIPPYEAHPPVVVDPNCVLPAIGSGEPPTYGLGCDPVTASTLPAGSKTPAPPPLVTKPLGA